MQLPGADVIDVVLNRTWQREVATVALGKAAQARVDHSCAVVFGQMVNEAFAQESHTICVYTANVIGINNNNNKAIIDEFDVVGVSFNCAAIGRIY